MAAETSPVKAPSDSQCKFCAPKAIGEFAKTLLTACRLVNGGHKTTSREVHESATRALTALANSAASWAVLCSFQLATIKLRRTALKVARLSP